MRAIERLSKGLSIFLKYEHSQVDARHDVLYASTGRSGPVSDADRDELLALKWYFNSEDGFWEFFT